MKVLVVGNYAYNEQESMQRFARLMVRSCRSAGHDVRAILPHPVFGRLRPGAHGLGKWLGYIDRFALFPGKLRRESEWADVVHICDQANAVYAPWLGGKPHVVTCHDVLAIRSALGLTVGHRTRLLGKAYQKWIREGLRQSQRVVCVSEQTRRELLEVVHIPVERVSVIENGLNYPYEPMAGRELRERLARMGLGIGQPYVLHVGGNQWYKNRVGVIAIFKHLSMLAGFEHYHLVMAGKGWTDEITTAITRAELQGRVHELIGVSNEDLRALYSGAAALVFPSIKEGFGWPVAEAQACGCPVFATNRPPMTDIGGDAACFFDPEDIDGAARVIAEALKDRNGMRVAGIDNARRFSEQNMAQQYLKQFEIVVAESA